MLLFQVKISRMAVVSQSCWYRVLFMQVLSAVDQDQIMDKREFTKFEL